MPHWNGEVETTSPAILQACNGDPLCILETLYDEAPEGANVVRVGMKVGENVALVTVAGRNAESYLRDTLEAKNIVQLVSPRELRDIGP